MKEKLALDLSPYKRMPQEEAHTSLSDDIASLSLEASGEINSYLLIATKDGKVINPNRPSTDILEQYSTDSEIENAETKAAIQRRDFLLSREGSFVVIWIGPSDPYPRGSLDVGISREIDGQKALESYGVWLDFSEEQYLTIGKNLSGMATNNVDVGNIEDLRGNTFLLELGQKDDPYDLLEEIIPLEGVWEKIRNGKAMEEKRKAKKEALKLTKNSIGMIKEAKTKSEILQIGAELEKQMQKRWSRIDFASSGCGITNSEMLNEYTYSYSHHQINKNGLVSQSHSEKGQYVKKCPYCGVAIQKVINPGFRCSCGNVYKGVC